jgi:hypothetical protein
MDGLTGTDFVTGAEQRQLLGMLEQFFELWEELHRVIPTGDRAKMEAASAALADQANKVRAFYG